METINAVLRTAGKTREQLKEQVVDPETITDAELDNLQRYYDLLDGARVLLMSSYMGKDGTYGLVDWHPDDDAKIKEATWLIEQDEWYGTYINQRDEFDRDWDAGHYSPDGIPTFRGSEVEEIVEEVRNG